MSWAALVNKKDIQREKEEKEKQEVPKNQSIQSNDINSIPKLSEGKQPIQGKKARTSKYQVVYKKFKRETNNVERQKLESNLYDVVLDIKSIANDNLNYLLDNIDTYRLLAFIKEYYNFSPIIENYYVKTFKKKTKSVNKNKHKKQFVNLLDINNNSIDNKNNTNVQLLTQGQMLTQVQGQGQGQEQMLTQEYDDNSYDTSEHIIGEDIDIEDDMEFDIDNDIDTDEDTDNQSYDTDY